MSFNWNSYTAFLAGFMAAILLEIFGSLLGILLINLHHLSTLSGELFKVCNFSCFFMVLYMLILEDLDFSGLSCWRVLLGILLCCLVISLYFSASCVFSIFFYSKYISTYQCVRYSIITSLTYPWKFCSLYINVVNPIWKGVMEKYGSL